MSTLQGDPGMRWTDEDAEFASDLAYLRCLLEEIEWELELHGGTVPPLPSFAPVTTPPRPRFLDQPPRRRWRFLGGWLPWSVTFGLIVGAALWLSIPAHADPVTDYTDSAWGAVCSTIDKYPSIPGVLGVVEGVQQDSGFTAYQAGQVVGLAVIEHCPRHYALLEQFAAAYSKGTLA